MEQKKLMSQIQSSSFAVYEAALYLDGHRNDRRALEYYRKMNEKRRACVEKYEKLFGPLTVYEAGGHAWRWTDGAWPWEYEAN